MRERNKEQKKVWRRNTHPRCRCVYTNLHERLSLIKYYLETERYCTVAQVKQRATLLVEDPRK